MVRGYAYGITVLYHTRMVHTIRVWYIPYAYNYVLRAEMHIATVSLSPSSILLACSCMPVYSTYTVNNEVWHIIPNGVINDTVGALITL